MTFWKRRNVVPCFITFYRRILLSNALPNLYLFELVFFILQIFEILACERNEHIPSGTANVSLATYIPSSNGPSAVWKNGGDRHSDSCLIFTFL